MSTDYREYVKSLSLVEALWWFIENVNDDTPHRTEIFFSLRERCREKFQHTKGQPSELIAKVKSLVSDIEAMQFQNEDWFGAFSEYEESAGDDTMSVEWPNLRISLDAVQAELNKLPADQDIPGSAVGTSMHDELTRGFPYG